MVRRTDEFEVNAITATVALRQHSATNDGDKMWETVPVVRNTI